MVKSITVRRITRHFIAALLWAHALFATALLPIHQIHPNSLSGYGLDAALLSFIIFYGAVCDFGWISVWFDVFYIYFWPFILFFKAIYLSGRYVWRRYLSDTASTTQESKPAVIDQTKIERPHRFVRVFAEFALIWCMVALHTQVRVLSTIAISCALIGAVRVVYALWQFVADATLWLVKYKGNLSIRLAESAKTIGNWDETVRSSELQSSANLIRGVELACKFLTDKKTTVQRATSIIAALITIPFYLYVSVIFACSYVGIARLEHIALDFKTALIDSLFVPIAFTDLPHSFAIRLIAGMQAIAIGAMGYNILFRHFNSKIEELSVAANELRQPLLDEKLMQRVVLIAATPVPPVTSPPTTTAS